MIVKINSLTSFGNYRQFQWGNNAVFAKRNLIYGWNYSGKTTLSRLFQVLADRNNLQKFPSCKFEVELQDGSKLTQANFTSNPSVKVFNRDFIQQNFQQEHKAPAVFIVGGNAIHLRKRIALHLTNLYEDGELSREATTEESSLVQTEGAFFGRDNFSACIHGLDAFLGRYECSLPEIFGRVAKHANRVVPA